MWYLKFFLCLVVLLFLCSAESIHAQSVFGNTTTRGLRNFQGGVGVGNSRLNRFRVFSTGSDRISQQFNKIPNPLRASARGNSIRAGLGSAPRVDSRLRSNRAMRMGFRDSRMISGRASIFPFRSSSRRLQDIKWQSKTTGRQAIAPFRSSSRRLQRASSSANNFRPFPASSSRSSGLFGAGRFGGSLFGSNTGTADARRPMSSLNRSSISDRSPLNFSGSILPRPGSERKRGLSTSSLENRSISPIRSRF